MQLTAYSLDKHLIIYKCHNHTPAALHIFKSLCGFINHILRISIYNLQIQAINYVTYMINLSKLLKINHDFIDQMPGLFSVFDMDSRVVIANKSAENWLGYKSRDDVVGKRYYDIPCKVAEQHEELSAQDQLIMKNNGHGKILGFYCYSNNDWKIILAEKFPFKNTNGDIIALASYITDLTNTKIIDISRFLTLVSGTKSHAKFELKQSGFVIQKKYKMSYYC